jgi:hypothetical protein
MEKPIYKGTIKNDKKQIKFMIAKVGVDSTPECNIV